MSILPFAAIPHDIQSDARLDPIVDSAVVGALLYYARGDDRTIVSNATIAERLRCSLATIKRSMQRLESAEWVARERVKPTADNMTGRVVILLWKSGYASPGNGVDPFRERHEPTVHNIRMAQTRPTPRLIRDPGGGSPETQPPGPPPIAGEFRDPKSSSSTMTAIEVPQTKTENPEAIKASIQAVRTTLGETIATQVGTHRADVAELVSGRWEVLPSAAVRTRARFGRATIDNVLFYMLVCALVDGLGREPTLAKQSVIRFLSGRNLDLVSSSAIVAEIAAATAAAKQDRARSEAEQAFRRRADCEALKTRQAAAWTALGSEGQTAEIERMRVSHREISNPMFLRMMAQTEFSERLVTPTVAPEGGVS
jgi:hypothetical protein